MPMFFERLDVVAACRAEHLSLWSCPPFLFIVMGLVNVTAMLSSYLLTQRYGAQPEIGALIVLAVTALIFVIGNFVIHGFTQIAEANRMKSEFIAIVSHQLRSPLSIFKWALEAMGKTGSGNREPAAAEHLEMLRENSEKMTQLVNTLLEVSRIEAGRLILHREPVRLDIMTEETIRSFTTYARASNVSLDYVVPANLPPVRGDPERLKMVVQNLVDNAVRFSPGGGRVGVTILPAKASRLEWRIQDSGVGIPAREQRFIFQKFFRSSEGIRHHAQGSGLGLYIAHSIITALGGEIGFHSEENQGSTFWFRLPVFEPAPLQPDRRGRSRP